MNTPRATHDPRTHRALSGQALYGDDFDAAEVDRWFEDEREGYFNLYHRDIETPPAAAAEAPYTYEALAQLHGFRWLPPRTYEHALGVGSAHGAELKPVLPSSTVFAFHRHIS